MFTSVSITWARNLGQRRTLRGREAGQGAQLWVWNEGQKSRSGPGVRKGLGGGQMTLYPLENSQVERDFWRHACWITEACPCNLKDIADAGFEEGEDASLESLKKKGLINPSGRDKRLPIKILGDAELSVKLNFSARAFSASAKEKLEAACCSLTTVLPERKKWVKPWVAKNIARVEEYFAKKRATSDSADSHST